MMPTIVSWRCVLFLLLIMFFKGTKFSQTEEKQTGSSNSSPILPAALIDCPTGVECEKLGGSCLDCEFNRTCIYGAKVNVTCKPKESVNCTQDSKKSFQRSLICRYCYQTDHWEHTCVYRANCNSVASPRSYYKLTQDDKIETPFRVAYAIHRDVSLRIHSGLYHGGPQPSMGLRTNCSVKSEILCLGNRTFEKNLPCNWTGGYRWSTALVLSITLGGFGADRFYLGHWQEGIGKLFSFGGLGVWTLIDVILIALHYLGPADGSLYI